MKTPYVVGMYRIPENRPTGLEPVGFVNLPAVPARGDILSVVEGDEDWQLGEWRVIDLIYRVDVSNKDAIPTGIDVVVTRR